MPKLSKELGKYEIHNLSFRLPLDSIPNWLNKYIPIKQNDSYKVKTKIINNEEIKFKPIILNNWPRPKYYVYINKADFGGIESVEINMYSIVFNFKRDQNRLFSSSSEITNYFKNRINDVRKCRDYFNSIGFEIRDEPITNNFHVINMEDFNQTIIKEDRYA